MFRGDCYYSSDNEVKVWKQIELSIKPVAKFEMCILDIAYRSRDDYEELLICLNEQALGGSKGLVRVVPLYACQPSYDFRHETGRSGPTRAAVNRSSGLVCLNYPYRGEISMHMEDGTHIQTYDMNYMGLSDSFQPVDICFDNDNCIIIAERGRLKPDYKSRHDGSVLRVNIFGKVLQVLVKGNNPLAVAVSRDNKLWVGYRDKDVTVYQMKNA